MLLFVSFSHCTMCQWKHCTNYGICLVSELYFNYVAIGTYCLSVNWKFLKFYSFGFLDLLKSGISVLFYLSAFFRVIYQTFCYIIHMEETNWVFNIWFSLWTSWIWCFKLSCMVNFQKWLFSINYLEFANTIHTSMVPLRNLYIQWRLLTDWCIYMQAYLHFWQTSKCTVTFVKNFEHCSFVA